MRVIRNSLAIVVHLRHFTAVRGSPLLRSIFIVLLLIASAVVLTRLTAAKAPVTDTPQTVTAPAASKKRELPYRLLLSAEASEVGISAGEQPPLTALSGNLAVPVEHPAVFLTVRWKNPAAPGEHRFAKLTLEPAGKPTLTHVFDADGDIDDVFELP